jgi:putative ABC transport system permease protein
MLKNYFKIAWRNLLRNKLYSFVNISGLSIGMAVCILIMLFVNFERDFDGFHSKNIYRLNEVQNWEGMVAPQKVALSMYPMGPTLLEEFPEIKNFTRLSLAGELKVKDENKETILSKTVWADSSFFQLFDFNLIEGNPGTALKDPFSIVLTQESAEKIFGNNPALGELLTLADQDTISYTVTGVMENFPKNSHLQFEALRSFNSYVGPQAIENWGGNWLTTYLELGDDVNSEELEKKFPDYLLSHMDEKQAEGYELFLQPLSEVHSGSADITHDYLNFQKFDKAYTRIFFYIAILVMVIAALNFVNLSTAKSINRAMEIGVRKVSGASRSNLYFQFIGESVFISLIAMFFALVLVGFFLPSLNQFSQRTLDFPIISEPMTLVYILSGAVLIGILSGLYPALYLSGFRPAGILKGADLKIGSKSGFRTTLVVVQFSAAIFLIISTIFASRQLSYMQEKDLGFAFDQIVTIPFGNQPLEKYEPFKQQLLSNSSIQGISASGQRLGNNLHQTSMIFEGTTDTRELSTSHLLVDPDFVSLYEMELVAGKNFTPENKAESGKGFILNESLAKELLAAEGQNATLESLIGKPFGFGWADSLGQIVGVVRDFNFNSLHHKIETLFLVREENWGYAEISVKINGSQAEEAIAAIETVWNQHFPEREFEYSFLNSHFEELYRADRTVNYIVGLLTILSILISCLGLFGLASFATEQRVKEIGIRKVLGASVAKVVMLLSKDFVKPVFWAIFLAVPISWFAVNQWLEDYAYRINFEWWIVGIAGGLALLLALLTVSFQSIKAAIANPVKSLKSE